MKVKPPAVTAEPKPGALVPLLLRWFAANARDLPWRRTLDPYAIWVSEIMLQQTQVKTVIPYWQRWLQQMPDIRTLAQARPDKVLKLWEGLGYYTRARNLQKAARQIVKQHDGRFPEEYEHILALPGVGRYTAGAIASIAFNQPAAILDGNVIRVLTRVFGIDGDPREKSTNRRLWHLAETLVQCAARLRERSLSAAAGPCSLLNQSLMELGALVCTPRQPRCDDCPIRRHCVALREGRIETLPNLARRSPTTARRFVALVVQRGERFLVRQRPAGVVNARLWEFPNLETTGEGMTVAEAARTLLGTAPRDLRPLVTIHHSITRYRISLESFTAELAEAPGIAGRWVTRAGLDRLAFASAHRQISERLALPQTHRRAGQTPTAPLASRDDVDSHPRRAQ